MIAIRNISHRLNCSARVSIHRTTGFDALKFEKDFQIDSTLVFCDIILSRVSFDGAENTVHVLFVLIDATKVGFLGDLASLQRQECKYRKYYVWGLSFGELAVSHGLL